MSGSPESQGAQLACRTPAVYSAIGFDGAGNFYYKKKSQASTHSQLFELAAGSTTNAQEVTSAGTSAADSSAFLNFDGTMQFNCNPVLSWLGPNAVVFQSGHDQIYKHEVTGRTKQGCPIEDNEVRLLPATNTVGVREPVGKPDGTQVCV